MSEENRPHKNGEEMSLSPQEEQEEQERLEIARELFLTQFPNPERIGCPGSQLLMEIATEKKRRDIKDIFLHVARCAPCSYELRGYRAGYLADQYKSHMRLKKLILGAATLLITAAVPWLISTYHKQESPSVQNPPGTREVPTPKPPEEIAKKEAAPSVVTYPEILLDARTFSRERGEPTKQKKVDSLVLKRPPAPARLKIYLPFPSRPGEYEVQIIKDGKPVWRSSSTAHITKEGITVAKTKEPLTAIQAGSYVLDISRADRTYHNECPLIIK